jgi:hypothetical protein
VRGSRQGESHGGLYLIDFDSRTVVQTLDWNTMAIDWQGRGWDRGLRGIAFDGEVVYVAASDELFAYTPDFRLIGSWRNAYLKHCHEICRHERMLFVTSTGFDAVLGFDLDRRRFSWGLHIAPGGRDFVGQPFDPDARQGPPANNTLHLNNVFCAAGGMHISGLRTAGILLFNGRHIARWAGLPEGAHNARPFRDGVLFNDTQADVIRYASRGGEDCALPVPRYPADQLTHTELDDSRIARQGFARGLCVLDEDLVAGGSSPSTITLHDFARRRTIRQVTLTLDVRNAIHGLEVWPY